MGSLGRVRPKQESHSFSRQIFMADTVESLRRQSRHLMPVVARGGETSSRTRDARERGQTSTGEKEEQEE